WLLLIALAPGQLPWPRLGSAILVLASLLLAAISLPTYYNDPTVRDNYAGVAAYIAATADAQQDLVILDAPGQQEVWRYYDPGIPILPLPQQRPADMATTIQMLRETTATRRNLYALFWATDEADPQRIVERWLDQQAFKGLERWQGNLRFVIYTMANQLSCTPPATTSEVRWGDQIALTAMCRAQGQQAITAGEAVILGLRWQATAEIAARYKVSVQLLNERNLIVEQHDGEPVGGSRPTDSWRVGETIRDNHGIVLPIGTPPGNYRLIVALYEQTTGARLPVMGEGLPMGRDYLEVGTVQVVLPQQPLPATLVPVQYSINRQLGPLYFVGYGAHRQGFTDTPLTPVAPGDPVEFTFVWQAPTPLPADWPATMAVSLTLGQQQITFAPAGDEYPTGEWSPGQLLRYSVLLPYDGTERRPRLQIGDATMMLKPLPTQ
ncbi:MAG: hypothetical protein KDE19_13075, partial [Caldilineaceae bacterium]|nr:hypothetical protein [Caldilineaceae bacterium]